MCTSRSTATPSTANSRVRRWTTCRRPPTPSTTSANATRGTSRCGRRPSPVNRPGIPRGVPGGLGGTSSARRWPRSTSGRASTSMAAASTWCSLITRTSRHSRTRPGTGSPGTGCTIHGSPPPGRRWVSPLATRCQWRRCSNRSRPWSCVTTWSRPITAPWSSSPTKRSLRPRSDSDGSPRCSSASAGRTCRMQRGRTARRSSWPRWTTTWELRQPWRSCSRLCGPATQPSSAGMCRQPAPRGDL